MLRRFFRAAVAAAGLACAVVVAGSSIVAAAEFQERHYDAVNDPAAVDFEPRCHIQMTGEIVGPDEKAGQIGDYERAKIALDAFRKSKKWVSAPGINREVVLKPAYGFFALCLSSEGGDLREALRIASLFQNDWMTVVEEGHACLSACAVLFMQPKRRDGLFHSNLHATLPGRYMHYGAEIGFHAPALIYPKDSSDMVAKAEAEEAYRQALISVEALLPNAAMMMTAPPLVDDGRPLSVLLDDMMSKYVGGVRSEEDFPTRLLVRMLTTPNTDMLRIRTVGEASEYGIGVYGLPLPRRFTDRMVMAACASVVHTRCTYMVPQGQCPYAFATESGMLAISRGVPGATAISSMVKSLQPPGKQFALDTAAGQQEKILSMLADWEVRRLPTALGASADGRVEHVRLQRKQADGWASPCAVQVAFDQDRLADVELQTLNGSERNWLVVELEAARPFEPRLEAKAPPAMVPVAQQTQVQKQTLVKPWPQVPSAIVAAPTIAERLARPETASRLRWQKVLPPTTPLAEITDEVWQWYEQGQPIGPAIAGAAVRASAKPAPAGLSQAAVIDAAARMQLAQAAKKDQAKGASPSDQQQAVIAAFNLPAWTRTIEGEALKLVSPPVKDKEGVSMVFSTVEKPAEKGGMEPWFKARVEQQLAGKVIRKRQGLQRKGPLWVDAVSLPNAQGIGGTVIFYKAWATRNGAQFLIETQPEHVDFGDTVAIEADALASKLGVQGVELTRETIDAIRRMDIIKGLKG